MNQEIFVGHTRILPSIKAKLFHREDFGRTKFNDFTFRCRPETEIAFSDWLESIYFGISVSMSSMINLRARSIIPHTDDSVGVSSTRWSIFCHFTKIREEPITLSVISHDYKVHSVNLNPGELALFRHSRIHMVTSHSEWRGFSSQVTVNSLSSAKAFTQ